MSQDALGPLAKTVSSACHLLLEFAERVASSRQRTFEGLEPAELKALVECEIGWLARNQPSAADRQPRDRTSERQEAAAMTDTAPPDDDAADTREIPGPNFSPVERAITLLMRDGNHRQSMRKYARLVGVHHSQLSRSDQWKRAWEASGADPGELPAGSKDATGGLEAWGEDEICTNCRQEPMTSTVTVSGEVTRVCEECAKKLAQRTNPRTT